MARDRGEVNTSWRPGDFENLGVDVELVEPYMIPILSLEHADAAGNVTTWGQLAHGFGAIAMVEARAWERHLVELDEAGQFFGAATFVHVAGSKPM